MLRPPPTSPHLLGTLGRAEILGSLQDTVGDLRPQREGCSHRTRFFHTARSLYPGPEPSKMLILKVSCPSPQAPLPPSPCSALQPPNGSESLGEHHTGVQSSGQPPRAAHNHARPRTALPRPRTAVRTHCTTPLQSGAQPRTAVHNHAAPAGCLRGRATAPSQALLLAPTAGLYAFAFWI